MRGSRSEIWAAKLRGYVYWIIILALVGGIVWLFAAYTGVWSDVVPGTDAAPGVDQDSTVRPDTTGIDKIKLTDDTMRVHVASSSDSDFSKYRITSPDGQTYQILVVGESHIVRENRPDGWPSGTYTLTEMDAQSNEYDSYEFELEPATS